ncbi:MAG: copper chaperone PCu(A)C [Arenibacterium sp.]
MPFKTFVLSLGTSLIIASQVMAQSAIEVKDPYARTSRPNAPSGAAFMILQNRSDQADRLISAQSDVAQRVELHTHKIDSNGVARMLEVEGGIDIPAGGEHALERGGDHVMFMGLSRDLKDGESVSVTLTFEKAGDVVVEIPVDLSR